MYFLIISFGFVLTLRGSRLAPSQDLSRNLVNIWREAADLFLTMSLMLALTDGALTCEEVRILAQEYTLLILGFLAYALSCYQKKTDVFFLAATAISFWIRSAQESLWREIFFAAVISAGIGFFQTGLSGLRYKLRFSKVPESMKGWPVLCLLAAFLSIVFQTFRGRLF